MAPTERMRAAQVKVTMSRTSKTSENQLNSKNNRSFSLIELVTVLGLLALAAAIVVPSLMFWMRSRELPETVETLRSAIDIVRSQCIAQGNQFGVSFQVSQSGPDAFQLIGIYKVEDPSDNVLASVRKLPASVKFRMPLPGAGLDSTKDDIGIPGDDNGFITFKTSGELDPRYLTDPNVDPQIVLAGRDNKSKSLSINRITGKVTVL